MMTTETKLLTAGDLLRLYSQGVRGELIPGVLCETMASGQEHGEIVMKLGAALINCIEPLKLGRVMGSDAGVWLERDPDTVREPDIAYFSAQRMPPDVRVTGYSEMAPDLVVEIASPGDSGREVNDKARMVDVHRADRAVSTLGEDDSLDGMDVLPGFTCAVGAVFGA